MPSEAFIAMTIKITDPDDDKFVARAIAERVSGAISTLLFSGGRFTVHTAVIEGSEAAAVDRLDSLVQS